MGKRTEQSRQAYDRMAMEYDSSPEGQYTMAHKAELLKMVRVRDGDCVLDVACGNGFLLAELAKKAKIKAFGIDISDNMIAIAAKRYPHCQFAAQPCFPLGFESESINTITVSCAFHHFENPQGFAAECMRVLKDGGQIYMAEPSFQPLIRFLANTLLFPFSHTGDVKVYPPQKLCRFFREAGFKDIQVYTKQTVLFFFGKEIARANQRSSFLRIHR